MSEFLIIDLLGWKKLINIDDSLKFVLSYSSDQVQFRILVSSLWYFKFKSMKC